MQKKTVVEKMMVVGGCELCRGGTSMGKMRGEKVNYSEEDIDREDEGGCELCIRGQ